MDEQIVREIQEALRALSFVDPRLIPLAVDGIFGSQTAEAVRIFQTLYGLEPTGEVDRATWEELRDSADELRVSPPNPLAVFPHPAYVLRPDEETSVASFVQLILRELSAYYSNIGTVDVSGIYDPETVNEVRNIQKMHRLEENGLLDLDTWNVLSTLFNNRFDTVKR